MRPVYTVSNSESYCFTFRIEPNSSTGCSTNTSVKAGCCHYIQMLSIPEESIVAITVQAFVTGACFASFFLSLRWLIFSDDGQNLRKRIDWSFLIITIILFAFTLINFTISLQNIFIQDGPSANLMVLVNEILVTWPFNHDHRGIELSSEFYTIFDTNYNWWRLGLWINKANSLIFMTLHQIFRCWMVYNRSWRIIILPLLLLLYNISLFIIILADVNVLFHIDIQFLAYALFPSYYGSTIVINMYATCTWWNYTSFHSTNSKQNCSCYYIENLEE